MPQPVAYEQLLAQTYDAIKATRPDGTVIGGALDSHGNDDPSPLASPIRRRRSSAISARAYRASGRTAPIMDVFDEHVYADNSSLPPSMPHTGSRRSPRATTRSSSPCSAPHSTERHRAARSCRSSTASTASRRRSPRRRPALYSGTEIAEDRRRGDAGAVLRRGVPARALPAERDRDHGLPRGRRGALGAWQSGAYYADGTPKSSLAAIRAAERRAREVGSGTCPDPSAAARLRLDGERHRSTANATDNVGVGKVTLFVNGARPRCKYAAPVHVRRGAPKKDGPLRDSSVRRRRRGRATSAQLRRSTASRPRRREASEPAGWVLQASAARRGRALPPRTPRPRG